MKLPTDDAELLHAGDFLHLYRRGHWEFVQRRLSTGAVFILARTDADELVLVEQLRLPLGCPTLELPAGIAGDQAGLADEGPVPCALRELEEETGFRAEHGEVLFDGPTAPGLAAEWGYFVRAEGLRRVGPGGGVGDEDIRVHCFPLSRAGQIASWAAERGLALDHRVYVGLWWLLGEGGKAFRSKV